MTHKLFADLQGESQSGLTCQVCPCHWPIGCYVKVFSMWKGTESQTIAIETFLMDSYFNFFTNRCSSTWNYTFRKFTLCLSSPYCDKVTLFWYIIVYILTHSLLPQFTDFQAEIKHRESCQVWTPHWPNGTDDWNGWPNLLTSDGGEAH